MQAINMPFIEGEAQYLERWKRVIVYCDLRLSGTA